MVKATLTVEEAAETLGIGRSLAYMLVHEGKIPSIRLGGKRLVVPRVRLVEMLEGKGAKDASVN